MVVIIVRFLLLASRVCRFLLLTYALLSWLPNVAHSRFGQWLAFLVEPLLKPFRRLPLQVGGLDFTVLLALLAFQLFDQFLLMVVFA